MQDLIIQVETDTAPDEPSGDLPHADPHREFADSDIPCHGREVLFVASADGRGYAIVASEAGFYWVERTSASGVDTAQAYQYFSSMEAALEHAAVRERSAGNEGFAAQLNASFDSLMTAVLR